MDTPYKFYKENYSGALKVLPGTNTPYGLSEVNQEEAKRLLASGLAGKEYFTGSNAAQTEYYNKLNTDFGNVINGIGENKAGEYINGAYVDNSNLANVKRDLALGASSVQNGQVIPSAAVKSQFVAPAPLDSPKTFDTGVGSLTVVPKTSFQDMTQKLTPNGAAQPSAVPSPLSGDAGLFARQGIDPYKAIGGTGYNAVNTPSVQDYFTVTGRDPSFAARAKEAATLGITNYTGSAAQNTALLTSMRNKDLEAISPGITKLPAAQQQPIVLQSIADYLKQQQELSSQGTQQNSNADGLAYTGGVSDATGPSTNTDDNIAALNKVNSTIATLTQKLLELQTQPYATQARLQSEGALSPFVQGETARNAEINAILQLPVAQQLQAAGIQQQNILKIMEMMKPTEVNPANDLINPLTGEIVKKGVKAPAKLDTSVVELGGQKVLIDNQTGKTIQVLGSATTAKSSSSGSSSSSSSTTKSPFTTTQVNKGAANAGISIDAFKKYSIDAQNIFINRASDIQTKLKAITTALNSGESPDSLRSEISNDSSIPPEIKSLFLSKIPQVTTSYKPSVTDVLKEVPNTLLHPIEAFKSLFGL